ncbi:hypothetical protein GCM10010174_65310 [Kutzneria viridogrisea]
MAAFTPTPMAAGTATECDAFQVRMGEHETRATLSRVNVLSGATEQLKTLPYGVNAIGYARGQDRVYGIGNEGHVISIDRSGAATDHGQVRGVPRGDLALATAGAIGGNLLFVRLDDRLFTIDVAPGSATFLSVVRVTRLRPGDWVENLDDFAFDEADGLLYGVSTGLGGPAAVVSVDPVSGAVRKVSTPSGLPDHGSYGSAVIDSARTLHVLNNRYHDHSVLYEIPHGATSARQVAQYPATNTSDMAGCLGVPAPPPPTTTPPPTTVPPPPPPPVAPPPPPPPAPAVVVPPPPVVPPKPEPPAPVPSAKRPQSTPKPKAVAKAANTEVTKERRWAMATLVLVLGAGAVATSAARARAK